MENPLSTVELYPKFGNLQLEYSPLQDLAVAQEKKDVVILGLFGSASDAEPFLKAAGQLREDASFAHSIVSYKISL